MIKRSVFCLLCLFFPSGIYAQEAADLTADNIIEIVTQKHLENDRLKSDDVAFERREITYKLDRNGGKKNPDEKGKLVDSKNAKNPIDLDRFLNRYNFNFAIPAEENGNYRINFYPKSITPDESDIIYQTANHLHGILHINKQHLYVVKFNANLLNPFDKYKGFVRINQVDIEFEQEMRSDLGNIVVLKYFSAIVRYKAVGIFQIFEQWYYKYQNYRLNNCHCSPPQGRTFLKMNNFKILKKDSKSKARLGVLTTPHGIIKTPSYVFVGTYGKILHLNPADIKKTKTQLIIANTFHLWKKAGKSPLHFGKIPTMTDSGGFQVLSLAFADKSKVSKFMSGSPETDVIQKRTKIKITNEGVYFKYDNKWKFLGPELSMKLQSKIGADIIFAFDHITSPLDTYAYNKKALKLTDKWARICLKTHNKQSRLRQGFDGPKQMLFGIVQGGLFKDLRIQSAKSIGSMPFDGFGIGGSYTKKQIAKVLKWITPHLPKEKPRHLLGVGKVEDIFEAIENGIDTFDCVIPTREARHGRLYTKSGHIDIRRGYFAKDKKIIEKGCDCPTCSKKISRAKIRELLKGEAASRRNGKGVSPSQVAKGQRWCLMHNMWFFNNLLENIRSSIAKDEFKEFKKKYLKNFK